MDDQRQRDLLASALVYTGGTHTVEDVLAAAASGQMQMWVGEDSIVVTEILTYPRLKELNVFLAAGHLDEIRRLNPIILEWGRMHGCQRATAVGRRGWERTFVTKEAGWTAPMTVYARTLVKG